MGKKGKVGKNRQDKFYQLAKEQGYRSRAAFKLVQLNKRHDFLSSAARGVLDLCAAPGGWMQIARKHLPVNAPCVGIDLVPIRPVPGCLNVIGDITTDTTRAELRRALRQAGSEEKVDVVLNDGSPNMGKSWLQDAYTQSELTLAALKLATEFLAAGGSFVTKVFRSNDYNSLLFVMNQLFQRVNATKPTASRTESAEIYVMCVGFKAPKSIDQRLLNPKYVFKDLSAPAAGDADADKPDLFLNTVIKDMKKQKRKRQGYEDEAGVSMFKKISALQFCRDPRPVALMVESSQFSFLPSDMIKLGVPADDAKKIATLLESLPETTSEVLSCCEDLKIFGRKEFKLLLKWRSAARQELLKNNLLEPTKVKETAADRNESSSEEAPKQTEADGGDEDDQNDEIADDEAELNEELKTARAEALATEKRKRRKTNKVRNAIQRKIDMKIILPDQDDPSAEDSRGALFSLNSVRRMERRGIQVTDVPIADTDVVFDDDGNEADAEDETSVVPEGARVGLRDKDSMAAETEEELDRWYKLYLTRKKRDKNGALLQESKERKRVTKRKALRQAYENEKSDAMKVDIAEEEQGPKLVIDSSEVDSECGEDENADDDDFHVSKNAASSREAALWFSQPMFKEVAGISSDEEYDIDMADGEAEPEDSGKKMKDVGGDVDDFRGAAIREAEKLAKESVEEENKVHTEGDHFEVVPMDPRGKANYGSASDGASESSFHSSDYDTDEKAEMVAIGKRMRQSKKEAVEVMDEAYNRYTFDDPMELPRWFADRDPEYRKRQKPVTKDMVMEVKEYFKSMQAKPTKKEAEAKARKKARAEKKLEAMNTKANNIAEQSDVPASSRMRQIEDLYKQAMKSGKNGSKSRKKVYQVMRPNGRVTVGKNAGKGRKVRGGVKTTLVDRRLKADKRGIAKAERKAKKSAS